MTRCVHAFALSSSMLVGVAGTAHAGFCRSETIITGAGSPSLKASQLSNEIHASVANSDWGEVDGASVRSGTATAEAGAAAATWSRMQTHSNASWVNVESNAETLADDIIVRRRDGGDLGSTIQITTSIRVQGSGVIQATGPISYPNNPNFSLEWSYDVYNGSGFFISGRRHQSGLGGMNLSGASGDSLDTAYSMTFEVVVGEAFGIRLKSRLTSLVMGEVPGTTVDILASGGLTLGMPAPESGASGSRMAFLLPEGYTAESATLGIADNMIAAVPGPGAAALVGVAFVFGGRRRR